MWSPIVLLFVVGLTFASNPGWQNDKEYVYKLSGYSVASLDISDHGSGIAYKALLRLQPQSDNKIRGLIEDPQFVDILENLPEPSRQLDLFNKQYNWKRLQLCHKPFEVSLQNGRIVSFIVDEECSNWEVNLLKSAMSQFQLNTNADRLIESPLNSLPEDGDWDNDAVYLVMEDTVSGEVETTYNIRPLPDHVVQSRSNEARYLDSVNKGRVIEVIKHHNYSNSIELPSYSYGFGSMEWGKPAYNAMGKFLMRDSTSRAILTGTLHNFTVQSSITVNVISVSPTLSDNDKGSVLTVVNATLEEVKSQEDTIEEIPQPVNIGNLVYSYEKPFSSKSTVVPKSSNIMLKKFRSEIYRNMNRQKRSLDNGQIYTDFYVQDKPQLSEAPASPLLPYTIGYEGISIKSKINIVQEVQKLAQSTGKQMYDVTKTHHEELLDEWQTMISLMRIMNFDELQEVAKALYTTKYEGEERAIWVTFRDAIAELGTGPALKCIADWLRTNKIWGEEANQIVSTMTSVVREPTEEYIKALFELSKSPEVQNQWPVNNTLLLGLTNVIRRVYVDKQESNCRFPVKSFGSFYSVEGSKYVEEKIVPYLSEQMNEAIRKSDTHKIHSYIRIIANTGSYTFLKTFEPYLEGKEYATQFQRVLMVLAMSKLSDSHPKTARSILYRIYRNPADVKEVRIAAVYQLMRTEPPFEMMQDMAAYTNIEEDDYVNAAVISSIETASTLEGYQFEEIRKGAQAAMPLLTKDKTYGLRHGANYLRTYVVEELSKLYGQAYQLFGSEDSRIPKGFSYDLRQYMGGVRQTFADIIATVSSVDDLFQVTRELTKKYDENETEQKQRSQEQEKNSWSSQNIAKILNLKTETAEHLEAFMYMQVGKQYYMAGMDNTTLEQMPEVLRQWEEEFEKEKYVNMYKLRTLERTIAFPTALGIPFVFTHDQPMLVKVQGKFRASANPRLVEDGKINMPDRINLIAEDMKLTITSKLQGRLSSIAPYNHQQYIAGFDKHFELNIPVSAEIQIDVKQMNAKIEVEIDADKEFPLWHYKTSPYVSKVDVTKFEAISKCPHTKVIKQGDLRTYETTIGEKSTGMAFRARITHSRAYLDMLTLSRILTTQGSWDAIKSIWDDNSIQYGEFDFTFRPEVSDNRKAVIQLSYENIYKSKSPLESFSEWILNENAEPLQRQTELINKISSGIKNVQTVSLDASVEFEGQNKIKYVVTGAVAKSNVDPKSRFMIAYKRQANLYPHEFHVTVNSYIPNTNGIDLDYTLQNEPVANYEVDMKFGSSKGSLSKIEIQMDHRRSEERKSFLKQMPSYKQCKDEVRVGNKQLPACVNITEEANLLDHVSAKLHYANLDETLMEYIKGGFEALKVFALPSLETIDSDNSLRGNTLELMAAFHPDLRALNISVKSPEEENIFKNIPIDDLSKELFVVHPVFNVRTRLASYAYELDTYRTFCTVDKTHINTFSNLTYPADLSKQWTLLLQYFIGNSDRNRDSLENQLKSQLEHFVILARESSVAPNKKDLKIVVSSPETNFRVVEINITPNQRQNQNVPRVTVTVNGNQIQLSEKESYDVNEGYIQIYALPNGEVKAEFEDAFYVICDGSTIRITTFDGKFENRIIGACGIYTQDVAEDLMTPEICIARHPEQFIRSFEVEGQEGVQARESFRHNSSICIERRRPLYVDVITPNDYRRKQEEIVGSNRCTYYQTKYQEQGAKTCFTIHPQPVCSSRCKDKKQVSKKLPVHCVTRNMADMWKTLIDNGSGPDLSGKPVHQMLSMSISERCSPSHFDRIQLCKMWSQFVLFILVGLAYASNYSAWKRESEYVYQVRGRTLTGISEVSHQYVGTLFRATLRIQPRDASKLQMMLINPEYSEVHSVLSQGWETDIPEEETAWKPFKTCTKPFQAHLQNGKISNLIVHAECKNSEANLIKSIVSLFQINTNGENTLPSPLNTLPDAESNSGVFLTKEDTILGVSETLYKIAPIPDYELLHSKENARYLDFKLRDNLDADIIEVTKHEKFSEDEELPAYVYGFGDYFRGNKPATNKMGNYMSRDSTSRAILLGNLNRYDILHTLSVNSIFVNPTITDKEKAAVYSAMMADLLEIKPLDDELEDISQPVELGNLVYSYDNVVLEDRQRRPGSLNLLRPKYFGSEYNYYHQQPRIDQAPENPLLPFFSGYSGTSIRKSVNIVQEVQKLARKINKDLEDEERDHHEKTLERYVNLVSLIRLLDADELKPLINRLSSDEDESLVSILIDAVSEAGTGPAMLVIQDWIERGFIEGVDASEVVFSMANSATNPTEEYMKTFFKLAKNPKVLALWPLNDTTLMSFTHLARKVYADRNISDSHYPVNTFGSFRTKDGWRFIGEEVIPYFTEMLNNAVQRADTYQIHAYIRALGNLADSRILNTFEPYLEGKKHCTQFQRMLMVLSLEKLAETQPEKALAVFFRIYQNPAEHPAVRIAAVFQAMRSLPTFEVLQIMASNTHVEVDDHVNAAVKSAIETLSQMEGDDYTFIREAAKAARALLDDKDYGLQHGANYFRSYVWDELRTLYGTAHNFVPSGDDYIPKGMIYTLQASLNGLHRNLVNIQAIVSSVDQLLDLTYKQTKNYREKEQLKRESSFQENPWASHNIAKLLNMKAEEREQLEGQLYMELGSPLRMLSFDNLTIEQLPQYIQQFEKIFNKDHDIRRFKFFNARELILAVPTVTGFPMVYKFDNPVLFKIRGQASATAEPQLSSNDEIQVPNHILMQSELRWTLTGKSQGRLMFITPSIHQQFISGYDKHWEVNVPKLESNFSIDIPNQEVTVEIEVKEKDKMDMLHYHTLPYTAKSDIGNFEPLSSQRHRKPIQPRNMHGFKQLIGKEYIGAAFEIEVNHERDFLTLETLYFATSHGCIFEGLRELWHDSNVQNSQFDLRYLPEESSFKKIIVKSKYNELYLMEPKHLRPSFKFNDSMDQCERQNQMMDDVADGINNARANALDTIIELQGDRTIRYLITGAYAKSNVDPTSRVAVFFKRTSNHSELKDYQAKFVSKSTIENTNALDIQFALNNEPKVFTEVELTFEPTNEKKTKITGQFEHLRSEERKKYLKDSPLYKLCMQQMQKGNTQSYTCTNMTTKANLLDLMKVELHTENLDSKWKNYIETAYEALRYYLLPLTDVQPVSGEKDSVSMQVKFDPDLRFVNLSITTPKELSRIHSIEVMDLVRETFVMHPVFHLPNRLSSYYLGIDTYRDFCSIDRSYVNTFSNKSYDAKLSQRWTVMTVYVPKEARESNYQRSDEYLETQLEKQLENYAVLVRRNSNGRDKTDVKIVVSSPETDFEVIEIDLTPTKGFQYKPQVSINGEQLRLSQIQSADFKRGYIQVYFLPNEEVKVEVYNSFYIIYNGRDVRLTAVNGKFRDSIRGLCGQFNGQKSEDFIISETCIARSPEKFVRSFEIEGDEGKQVRKELAEDNKQCVEKEIPLFVNVITTKHAYHQSYLSRGGSYQNDCMISQTRYVQENGEICFTTKPLPACKSPCKPSSQKKKTIGVHCLQETRVAQLWKNQIDQGLSPDFSNKKQHKVVEILAPESCSM
ncbi:vitellogenin-like [Diorhabda sublineata]|uniref:vitellogenin-like n=1 Tax=Diorhabda sublineata TaxID=1163346 RepID=UPI0024E15F57|nr:vitellogenin-like [Diorhabda sublineata]